MAPSVAAHEPLPLALQIMALRRYARTKAEAEGEDFDEKKATDPDMLEVYKAVKSDVLRALEAEQVTP